MSKRIYSEDGDGDRRPHNPEKFFAPGEFTKLFQKALETVDLIFSEGIEWTAFLESFQQLQAEVKSEDLSIQAIERKAGTFIVRLEVPEEANKAEIEKYIKQEYETKLKVIEGSYQKQLKSKDEDLIKAYREKSSDMLMVIEMLSSSQQQTIINNNLNMTSGNTYNTEKTGIVHNEDSPISGGIIAGEYNEAAKQDLTQAAAAEIQQLLDQLAQDNPTKTFAEKGAVADIVVGEIVNNPSRWQKVIKVIKAMGIEALAEALDNPIFNIAKAGIEEALA